MSIIRWLGLGLAMVLLTGCSAAVPAAPSASPFPAVTPTPPAASPTSGWRKVQEFEPPPSTEITSATVGGRGFVAVGSADVTLHGPCFGKIRDGRVLSSADGEQWTTVAGDTFAFAKLDHVVESGDDLYVLGRVNPIEVGLEEAPGACGQPPENLGFNIWRSADEGASWERLAQSVDMQNADVTDIISVDGVLVAVGNVMDPDSRELVSSAVWTSLDGIEWRMTDTQPTTSFRSLASSGSVIVAAGNGGPAPLTYSEDGGRNWHQATVALDPAITHWSVAARAGRFLAVGGPETSDDDSMSVLASEDGKVWTEVQSLQLDSITMERLAALPDSFLGLEGGWVSEDGGRRFTGDIRTWLSVDGTDWLPGPAFPAEGFANAVAAGPNGIVVATWSRDALWFAPLSTFE